MLNAALVELYDHQKWKIRRQALDAALDYQSLGEFGTKYFLRCKVAKRSKSFVREFEKSNGDVIHDSFEIEKQFYDHFKCILETPDPLPSVATLRLLINKICNWPAISSQSSCIFPNLCYAVKI